jgi:hypothetical protein
MKSSLLTIIAFAFFSIVHAQSNYQKATIITNNSEKLNGWVNYKEWNQSPTVISFKTDPENSEIKKYTVKDISYLEVQNMEYYERFYVSISTDKREPLSELTVGPDNSQIKDTVFLKIIQKGKSIDLYSYRDKIKTRYYIKEKGKDNPEELTYKKYMDSKNPDRLVTVEDFKHQLIEVAKGTKANTSTLLELLLTTEYKEKDIARITDLINGSTSKSYPLNKPPKTSFYVGAALSSSKASYDGDHVLAANATNKISYFPKLTMGIDFRNNPFIGKLLIRFDLSFTGAKHEMSTVTEGVGKTTHSFNQYTGSLTPQVIYNFYNSDRLKVNAGLGISLNVSQYSNNKKQFENYKNQEVDDMNEVDLESFWIAVPVRIGTVVKKKYEVYAQYNYPISSITNYTIYSISVTTWQVGFNYLF